MSEIAIDIETISPELDDASNVDFLDSRDFELLCVGVGYRRSPDSDPESDILWREETGTAAEYKLIRRVVDWMQNRHYDRILTYNGVQFDARHLRGRASIHADELGDLGLPADLHRAIQAGYHYDLIHHVIRDAGERMSFEDAVAEYTGERPPRVQWDGGVIENGDIPELGERLLAHRAGLSDMPEERAVHLQDVLNTYVEADIEPLFDLHDALCD